MRPPLGYPDVPVGSLIVGRDHFPRATVTIVKVCHPIADVLSV
jgi:hypothetical protein